MLADWKHVFFCAVVICAALPGLLTASDVPELFAAARDALAIVKTGRGTGSGFVGRMNGKRYLITNEHVFRGGQPFSAILLDGRKLSFASLDVAEDRDLIRLELTSPKDIAGLVISAASHNIGEPVTVFGNSEGSGVATSISGKLLGVGPFLIEIDAPFVRGNSGSPIVDRKGEVIGVATFAVRASDPGDWIRQGTRFTDVRRFGATLNEVRWKTVDQADYFTRAEALVDIETFCADLYNLRFTGAFADPDTGLIGYRYDREVKRYRRCPGLCKLLSDAVATFNQAVERVRIAYRRSQNSRSERNAGSIGAGSGAAMDAMLLKQRFDEHAKAFKKVYTEAAVMIQRNDWITEGMKNDAEFWLQVLKLISAEKGS